MLHSTLLEKTLDRSRSFNIDPGFSTKRHGKLHMHHVREGFWQSIVIRRQTRSRSCTKANMLRSTVQRGGLSSAPFGLKNVLFDNTCYPTDASRLTYKRFAEDVKSLTVTGEPAGVLSCPIHHVHIIYHTCSLLSPASMPSPSCCLLHVLMISFLHLVRRWW